MNVLIIKAAIGAAVGVAAAAVALTSYDLGEARGRKVAHAEAERELFEMEDRLKRLYKIGAYSQPKVDLDEADKVFRTETTTDEVELVVNEARLIRQRADLIKEGVDPDMLEKLAHHIETQGYATLADGSPMDTNYSGTNVFNRYTNEDVQDEDSTVTPNMDDPEPYVISEQEFNYDEDDHTKISLSYYPVDGIIADDQDRVVDDVESSIGIRNLEGFDADNTVIHVRNNRLRADFEIACEEGSYSETVLGIESGPVMERRGRPHRSPQDE